jgi:hypothetical protein
MKGGAQRRERDAWNNTEEKECSDQVRWARAAMKRPAEFCPGYGRSKRFLKGRKILDMVRRGSMHEVDKR